MHDGKSHGVHMYTTQLQRNTAVAQVRMNEENNGLWYSLKSNRQTLELGVDLGLEAKA